MTEFVKPLHPVHEMVLSMNELECLETMYKQLYPTKVIGHISHFTLKANKVILNNEIIGSVCSHSKKASVIGAYWPSEGSSLSTIDYTKLHNSQ